MNTVMSCKTSWSLNCQHWREMQWKHEWQSNSNNCFHSFIFFMSSHTMCVEWFWCTKMPYKKIYLSLSFFFLSRTQKLTHTQAHIRLSFTLSYIPLTSYKKINNVFFLSFILVSFFLWFFLFSLFFVSFLLSFLLSSFLSITILSLCVFHSFLHLFALSACFVSFFRSVLICFFASFSLFLFFCVPFFFL